MASDWIKMRTDIYRDPKTCLIADALLSPSGALSQFVSQICERDMTVTRNVMRNVTVGALVTVWGVMRHRGKRDGDDLVVRPCSLSVIDDIADLPGFGCALELVGWVVEKEKTIVFPRFFVEFNVEPDAEAKAKNAERQRRYREKSNAKSNALRNVTVAPQSNAREEKRREENNNSLTNTRAMSKHWTESEDFQSAWLAWLSHVAFTKSPLSEAGEQQQLYELSRFETSEAIDIVRYSTGRAVNLIMNGDHKRQNEPSRGHGGAGKNKPTFDEVVI